MAKAVASSSVVTGAKMTPPSITLLPDKKSPTNSHSSPARTGKNTPSNTEKKAHMNGHASPSHLAANVSSSHGGKPILEGYMKTDDRMRLAKERREERERSLVAREQLIREKERRARLQYERTVEERWRRLEEQRLKEDLRRAAVEEKRRQKLEEERERFEALMKRSLERSLQLEQRTKRWGRGCHPGAGDCENAPLPFSAASAFSHGIASPIPAVSESAPCSPHRSPFHSSVNHADHNRAGLQGGSQSTPNTPKKERLRRERRTASPGCGSPVRRSESPASVTKHLAFPTASKLASKIRAQSPSNAHQYHYSPTRQHPSPSDDRKAENDKVGKKGEQTKAEIAARKNADINSLNSSPPAQKNMLNAEIAKTKSSNMYLKGDASDKNQSPERRNQLAPKVDPSEKKTQSNLPDGDKKKESPSCTSKVAAGTSDAEEASRLLAERRRQARAQKELEEKKREQEEEEERLREEQLRKQLAQAQQRREPMNQHVKERGKSEEDPHLKEEEKRKKEQQEKELQAQMDREREKAKVQAQEDVERQRQDRELQTQQEEEERLQRKKRIEEIMKRTRKGEAESKTEDQVEAKCVSPPGDIKTVQSNAQVKEQVTVQVKTKDSALGKTDTAAAAAAQMDSQKQVKSNSHLVMHSVPDKKSETIQTSEVISSLLKVAKACVLKQEGGEVGINVNQQHRASVNVTDQIKREPTKLRREGGMMNSGGKGEGSALSSTDLRAEVSKQKSMDVPAAGGKDKGGSQVEVVRPPVASLPIGNLSPPVIKLEPLNAKHTGSCDEVQSMEVSPASKEELISIPEYSPVNEIQSNGMSNTRALEELMDLTGSITYVKLSTESTVGDCNKNLIEGVVSPVSDSQLMGVAPPSSNKLSIK